MKKVVLVLAVILAAFTTVNAQKSSKFISGTASYTKSTDVKASYSITPTIGYFVTNKVAVGVFGSFGETATESTTNTFFVKGLAAISFCTFCEKPIITKDSNAITTKTTKNFFLNIIKNFVKNKNGFQNFDIYRIHLQILYFL